jgi:hypothetical protein
MDALQAASKTAHEAMEEWSRQLDKMNESAGTAPPPAKVVEKSLVGAEAGSGYANPYADRIITRDRMAEIRTGLHGKSMRELNQIFGLQAAKRDVGIPLYQWLGAGGAPLGARWEMGGGLGAQVDPEVRKALDSAGASALIRQDLEPILYEIFVKIFPLADAIPTEPANGLVHAFDQQTSFGSAEWIGELDTVVDDRGVYNRAFTNIGILATRRGVSLKSQFAVLAGGAGFNPEKLELTSGMRAMTSSLQRGLLNGNWTDPTGTINNEIGPFNPNSIDGFRKGLYSIRNIDVDPATNPETDGSLRRAIDHAILPIQDAGGTPRALYGAVADQITFNEQQEAKERIVLNQNGNLDALEVGENVVRVKTTAGVLPFYGVPGGYVGSYVPANTGQTSFSTVRDIYVLDPETLSRPVLGSEGPTVLEIPIGVSGQLTHLFIIFMMTGLKIAVPIFNNKIRVKAS